MRQSVPLTAGAACGAALLGFLALWPGSGDVPTAAPGSGDTALPAGRTVAGEEGATEEGLAEAVAKGEATRRLEHALEFAPGEDVGESGLLVEVVDARSREPEAGAEVLSTLGLDATRLSDEGG